MKRPETTGERLRDIRVKAGEIQQETADALGVKRETVRNWEADVRPLKADTIIKLAAHFHKTADYLLGISEEPNPEAKAADQIGISAEAVTALSKYAEQFPEILSDVITSDAFFAMLASIRQVKEDVQNMKKAIEKGWREDLEYQDYISQINKAIGSDIPLGVVHPRHSALLDLSLYSERSRKLAEDVSGYSALTAAEKFDPAFAAPQEDLHKFFETRFPPVK